MMKKKIKINLLFILFIAVLVFSCHKKPDPWIRWYNITHFSYAACSQNGISEWGYFIDQKSLDTLDEIVYSKFGIFLNGWFDKQLVKDNQGNGDYGEEEYAMGNITAIELYSDNTYDNNHPAGTSLNDIVLLSWSLGGYNHNNPPKDLNEYLASYPSCQFYLFFMLRSPPENSSYHRFKIIYKDTEGNNFVMLFPQIKILKN